MTAYGAVISLKNTIEYILHSSHFSLAEPSPTIIQLAYNELQPLQDILERLDSTSKSRSRKKVNALDGRIKQKVWEFENLLESLLSQQILSQSRSGESLEDDVDSFIETLKDMEKEYIYELENMAEDGDEDNDDNQSISSRVGFGGTRSKMIGLSDQFQELKGLLLQKERNRKEGVKCVYGLGGMAGVGKTTLAEAIFEDPMIQRFYTCRAWVRVGRTPQQLRQLSRGIAAQLCGITLTGGDKKEEDYILKGRLDGKKCLVVLDDVWETRVLDYLISYVPGIKVKDKCIIFLFTSRDGHVTTKITSKVSGSYDMLVRFLNEKESMELLCHKVFGDQELCPPQLNKAAAKIAKKCEGLPLMIVTVADILYKSRNIEPEYWNDVAEERNSVFKDAYNEISEVLFPSYDYLPQYLKMPFLYMGVFPSDYAFPPSKLLNMLSAEGWFLDTNKRESLEMFVWKCLNELCKYKNLVLFNLTSFNWHGPHLHDTYRIYKSCWLHSSWRHVCRGEAKKNKFYYVLNRLVDAEEEGQRCLCLENNMLFGIKEFRDSMRCNCTRSVLFFGPYHQYPTPIDVGFRLLRELDALQLRFYTFPTQILTLVLLKYLALTCNGELPSTISKLFNLRVLIIHPHMSIRRCRAPSYVPIQIWDMQELEHIEILGKSLRPPNHDTSLERLSTLVGVNASISTIFELSKRIPNIRKLGVQIELTPLEDHNDLLSCFGCISTLESLETLKCSITNPVIKSRIVVPTTPSPLMLPRGLKKLHLSGMGFPWEYMDVIGSNLPYLQVLKLRSYAFRGSKWEVRQAGSFPSLEFLLIEDSDLVTWKPICGSFPYLTYLSMKHCYKLKELHWPSNLTQGKIDLVNCNAFALTCAKLLHLSGHTRLHITASFSFDEKPMTLKYHRYGGRLDVV